MELLVTARLSVAARAASDGWDSQWVSQLSVDNAASLDLLSPCDGMQVCTD